MHPRLDSCRRVSIVYLHDLQSCIAAVFCLVTALVGSLVFVVAFAVPGGKITSTSASPQRGSRGTRFTFQSRFLSERKHNISFTSSANNLFSCGPGLDEACYALLSSGCDTHEQQSLLSPPPRLPASLYHSYPSDGHAREDGRPERIIDTSSSRRHRWGQEKNPLDR